MAGRATRSCARCGASMVEAARFCAACGAPLAVPSPPDMDLPPGPPDGPPPSHEAASDGGGRAGRQPSRRLRLGVTVGALGSVAAVGLWLATRGDGGDSPSVRRPDAARTAPAETTAPTAATAPPSTGEPATSTTASPGTTGTPGTTVAGGAEASEYLGLVVETLEQATMPAGVTLIGGALVYPDYFHSVSLVEDEGGQVFWLARPRGTSADGSLVDWEVVDAVRLPVDARPDDLSVLGDQPCRVGDADQEGVVAALFLPTPDDLVADVRAAWLVDLDRERLVPLSEAVSCPNPAAGI